MHFPFRTARPEKNCDVLEGTLGGQEVTPSETQKQGFSWDLTLPALGSFGADRLDLSKAIHRVDCRVAGRTLPISPVLGMRPFASRGMRLWC